jgi:NitT/TauT family transport system permease protein
MQVVRCAHRFPEAPRADTITTLPASPDRLPRWRVNSFKKIWGEANALLLRTRKLGWVDLLVVLAIGGLLYGLLQFVGEPRVPHEEHISTSPLALPRYTFYSLVRGVVAYCLSLLFTLTYGYWAAKDAVAQRVLVPLLDILQSIPVLGFMPALLLVFVKLFGWRVGLEIAAIVAIFTGQAWNMTFSFYQSVRSVPSDMHEAATVYRFSWWERYRWVELPFAGMGLVWNSMMSMAGGWFFLAVIEGLEIGQNKYWTPGIGSFIHKASSGEEWEWGSILWGVLAMMVMIVGLDQFLWRPVVAWAQKFRVEEGGAQEATTSWFLNRLRRSRLLRWFEFRRRLSRKEAPPRPAAALTDPTLKPRWVGFVSGGLFALLVGVLLFGGYELIQLLRGVAWEDWPGLFGAAVLTLLRVLASTALGTLWAVPAGLAIGLTPRLSRILQPVVQVLASFPAPLVFPLVIAGLVATHVSLGWGSVLLMLMGTQWYILFNVIAGAMAIPADLKEAARSYNITGWQRFRVLYFPAIFPYLVTGWVTAAGGAWNASIVAEYGTTPNTDKPALVATSAVSGLASPVGQPWNALGSVAAARYGIKSDKPLVADGLGAKIMTAADGEDWSLLAASVIVMSVVVVTFNRIVWHRLYRLAEQKFSLSK